MKNFGKAILVSALGMAATAHAATDGNLGATSSGESEVILVKDNAVQITNVDDLDLGTHSALAGDIDASDDVCVFNSTASYDLTVTSANSGFALTNGTDTIPYAVTWADNTNVANPVVYNTSMTGLQGDRNSVSCNGGTNATFAVSIAAADFNSASPGTYTDTLTLTITPL